MLILKNVLQEYKRVLSRKHRRVLDLGASTRERKFKFRFLISAFAIDRFGEGTVGAIIIFSMESLARFFHFGVLIGKLG